MKIYNRDIIDRKHVEDALNDVIFTVKVLAQSLEAIKKNIYWISKDNK